MIAQALLLLICCFACYYIGQQEVHSYYIMKAKYRRQKRKDDAEGYPTDFEDYLTSITEEQ